MNIFFWNIYIGVLLPVLFVIMEMYFFSLDVDQITNVELKAISFI